MCSRISSPDIFLLVSVGKRAPKKILQENPWQNPPSFIHTTKMPDTFLQRGPGQKIEAISGDFVLAFLSLKAGKSAHIVAQ